MRSVASLALVFAVAGVLFVVPAHSGQGHEDERSTVFIAGAANPDEAFGTVEGTVLTGLAAAGVAAIFGLLIFAGRIQINNCRRLNRLEARLMTGDDDNA
ncbi:MAG: hypothetical protein GY847_25290 [Proteobacteria bacterium]|nr:hypothetical protein [Pseudomonadota bacterium]